MIPELLFQEAKSLDFPLYLNHSQLMQDLWVQEELYWLVEREQGI